ncbi:glutathione S-transferase family protein [Rhizobium halophytocola]|uniref:Glutathione S-transferase n=1 Tax=Rhizobium halophytocola TaxID=735519 RepID=A0ABS4DX09_9HYPH|nr:glutathione S-transferase family protein [Rhizobium halophytocola]MBP1850229.1 glutathione S-transferase [Rhizobium halophytocola]
MLTVYGVYRSRATRLFWLIEELGIAFTQVPVIQAYRLDDPMAADAPLNTRSPDFLRVNPFGAIPTIDDDGLVLHESLAIPLYLAKKHGGPLGPADLAEDALMLQWSLFAATEIEANALKLYYLCAEGRLDHEAGKAVAKALVRLLDRPLKALAARLADHPFLVGDRFTVADINVAEIVRYASSHAPVMHAHPVVAAWLKHCQARPAFQAMWARREAEAL